MKNQLYLQEQLELYQGFRFLHSVISLVTVYAMPTKTKKGSSVLMVG